MSKLAVFTSLFALIVMTGVCPSWSMAQSPWQQSTLNENKMSVEVGAKIFDRPGDDSDTPVVFDSVTNSTLFSTEQATDFGSNFGVEVKFTIPGNYDRSLEIRTVMTEWEEDSSITGDNLASSFFPDPLDPATVFTAPQAFNYEIESDYYSFEIMSKRAVRPGLTLSIGPRFISTTDGIAVQSSTTTTPITGAVTGTQLNNFDAKNSLVGLQVGAEINRPIAQSVYVTVFGRAGGYYNATNFRTSTSASDTLGVTDTTITRTRLSRSTESFVAEAGGRVNFEILPNCLATYIGYEATVIDGIALSSANVTNLGSIDTKNTVFFQAITFGANLSY